MKWLWIECPARLCTGSCKLNWPNGTFPITRSNEAPGARHSANEPDTIRALGYSAAAIAAVTGSSSTPVMSAPFGAKPTKLPLPQPGSRTAPRSNPSRLTAVHIAWTKAASV